MDFHNVNLALGIIMVRSARLRLVRHNLYRRKLIEHSFGINKTELNENKQAMVTAGSGINRRSLRQLIIFMVIH